MRHLGCGVNPDRSSSLEGAGVAPRAPVSREWSDAEMSAQREAHRNRERVGNWHTAQGPGPDCEVYYFEGRRRGSVIAEVAPRPGGTVLLHGTIRGDVEESWWPLDCWEEAKQWVVDRVRDLDQRREGVVVKGEWRQSQVSPDVEIYEVSGWRAARATVRLQPAPPDGELLWHALVFSADHGQLVAGGWWPADDCYPGGSEAVG